MTKWFATISCGNGMTKWELIEEPDYDSADRWAREDCIDFASSYGYYQDLDHFGDYDQLYKEDSWCDEEEDYMDITELDYFVVEYDPEEHDGYL
ncbi:hypothetical protein VPHK406_0182 [Vibrio phage K406]